MTTSAAPRAQRCADAADAAHKKALDAEHSAAAYRLYPVEHALRHRLHEPSGFIADPLGLIDYALVGKYHLWFLLSMIGVYLLLPSLGLDTMNVPVWAGMPMILVFVTLICFAVSALLLRIPVSGRWIV